MLHECTATMLCQLVDQLHSDVEVATQVTAVHLGDQVAVAHGQFKDEGQDRPPVAVAAMQVGVVRSKLVRHIDSALVLIVVVDARWDGKLLSGGASPNIFRTMHPLLGVLRGRRQSVTTCSLPLWTVLSMFTHWLSSQVKLSTPSFTWE